MNRLEPPVTPRDVSLSDATSSAGTPAGSASRARSNKLAGGYGFAVALLLPIDWFAPTGELFREFGAKPATMLLTFGGLAGLFLPRSLSETVRRKERRAVLALLLLLSLGLIGFMVNYALGWSSWQQTRNPLTQAVTQTALLAAAALAVVGNARLTARYGLADAVANAIPYAAAFHLAAFLLQAAGVIDSNSVVLQYFRAAWGIIERPTGLMSEPSYYGTGAALFATALLALPSSGFGRTLNLLTASALFVSSVLIDAKTTVVVALLPVIYLLTRPRQNQQIRALYLGILIAVAWTTFVFIDSQAALDVYENRSSATRFGSTVLALNASASGYAVTGIGTGQFHFFYRSEFAPDFLSFADDNSILQSMDIEFRASTYNLYARVLLEIGVLGLLLLAISFLSLLRTPVPPRHFYTKTIFLGAMGFLLTQDTYFYPPLVLASALLLGTTYPHTPALQTAAPPCIS